MKHSSELIVLSEADLKEIFSLFTSSTKYERDQIYSEKSGHHFIDVDLNDEYSLSEERREYALDAWRAVIYFLYSRGYVLSKNGEYFDLSFSEAEFVD